MSELEKPEVQINISGVPEKYKTILALVLSDFLDFTGFEVKTNVTPDPTDAELVEILSKFSDELDEMTDVLQITVTEQ